MVKNQPIPKDKINEGDNFFMLRDGYESDLNKLPNDLLANMIIDLKQENKELKSRIRILESALREEFSTHGR